ncbi:MAG TPA: bifunctional DNA-formamidopyrimidine glycosylase/DNA-(apurinic or apyrimidinic site) lyase [Candidatus Cloacimonadota bacterium]|nr:bifunctional DNA-formamidopyrimidine glycosylase/DNA-(apurinic or apyrimidinic site) lyase [Candidatus Cloacimonadota bacterium]HPM01830.1 bifunctional DNA-formamidopyrimidine glycosylase/DNA-(apurinic or apyrimidinic site) lyase [Candidatus Cloacimonadota bacterium]
MPELPEVETICKELNLILPGQIVNTIESKKDNMIIPFVEFIKCQSVISVQRRAKYILIYLSLGQIIIIHLRMTGKLIYPAISSQINKYTRVVFYLQNEMLLLYDDVRSLGKIYICNEDYKRRMFEKTGVEPFSPLFNSKYLIEKAKRKHTAVKPFLMDQSIIAGIGNIYAVEILFKCRISPLREVSNISVDEWDDIIRFTVSILKDAIVHNGTTISDFRRVDEKNGEFQNFLQIYGKAKCPHCYNELTSIKQAGRSSRYCSKCQQ